MLFSGILLLSLSLCAQSSFSSDRRMGHVWTSGEEHHWDTREEEYNLGYRQCDLYPALRHDCGYFGIDEDGCSRRGCCYSTSETSGVSWCYYARDMLEDQCTVAPGERAPCGEYGIEKEACLAEGCCWQPKGDPDTPWCYTAGKGGQPSGPSRDCEYTRTEGACPVTCGSGVRTIVNTITSPASGSGQACPPEVVGEYCHTGVECDGCGGNLVGPSGSFTSPNYPDNYPDYQDCAWIIQDLPGQMIKLTFTDFNVEYGWDYVVVVYVGDSGITYEGYTGSTLPPVLVSTYHSMTVYFFSDWIITRPGFSATYETLDYGIVDCEFTTVDAGCSVTCGSGITTQINTIITPPINGGAECPEEIEVTGTCDTEVTCPSLHDEEDRCGVPVIDPSVSKRMIVGGIEAVPHSWPWQVSLFSRSWGGHFCGAVVLSKDWILTAAHCVDGPEPENDIYVRAGVHMQSLNDSWVQESDLKFVYAHDNFGYYFLNDDIALLQVETPLVYTDAVQPACLPEAGEMFEPGMECQATGWGSLIMYGESPDALQQVEMPIIDHDICNEWFWGYVGDKMVCVGYEEGGRSACHGDSGGPLVMQIQDRYVLVGVTSWGYICGGENMASVYTRVSGYIDWIYDHTESGDFALKR